MPDTQRCQATAKRTGKQCENDAIEGGNVCYHHGGSASQVKKKAKERLNEAASGAAKKLVNKVDEIDEMIEDADDNDRVSLLKELRQYVKEILDRAGPPKVKRSEMTGEDGGPVELTVDQLDDMTEEELEALEKLQQKLQ